MCEWRSINVMGLKPWPAHHIINYKTIIINKIAIIILAEIVIQNGIYYIIDDKSKMGLSSSSKCNKKYICIRGLNGYVKKML